MTATQIIKVLQSYTLAVSHEVYLQQNLAEIFTTNNIEFKKEYWLDKKNKIDFFVNGVGIEIKTLGTQNARKIFDQCRRYAQFDEITELILITHKTMGFPKQINKKPSYIFNLSRAWL